MEDRAAKALRRDSALERLVTSVKHAVGRVLASPPVRWMFQSKRGTFATILMLHRFADPDVGCEGHDPQFVREAIGWLRGQGFQIVGLLDVVESLMGRRAPLRQAVAFTCDDGYLDQARAAEAIFAPLECPVTIFLTSDFLDRRMMMWWDEIEIAFRNSKRTPLELELGEERLVYRWANRDEMRACEWDFTLRCKTVADDVRRAAIAAMYESAGVSRPEQPVTPYQPMDWETARRLESMGVTFGPHTRTHPILSRTGDARCQEELSQPWERLNAELVSPLPVFCYPNGHAADFGAREKSILASSPIAAAVSAMGGHAEDRLLEGDSDAIYEIPRYALPDTIHDLQYCVTGVERFAQRVGLR